MNVYISQSSTKGNSYRKFLLCFCAVIFARGSVVRINLAIPDSKSAHANGCKIKILVGIN